MYFDHFDDPDKMVEVGVSLMETDRSIALYPHQDHIVEVIKMILMIE